MFCRIEFKSTSLFVKVNLVSFKSFSMAAHCKYWSQLEKLPTLGLVGARKCPSPHRLNIDVLLFLTNVLDFIPFILSLVLLYSERKTAKTKGKTKRA